MPLYNPSSGGDFTGPGSATDNAVVRFDGATGKVGQNSTVFVTDGASPSIQLGGATDAFPMIARNSAVIEVKKADGSTYADVNLLGINAFGSVTFQQNVTMSNLPTSDPVAAGQLWSNLGIVTVSAG